MQAANAQTIWWKPATCWLAAAAFSFSAYLEIRFGKSLLQTLYWSFAAIGWIFRAAQESAPTGKFARLFMWLYCGFFIVALGLLVMMFCRGDIVIRRFRG